MRNCVLVTSYIHAEWVGAFYQEALNDPQIARFMSMTPYVGVPEAHQNTWERAIIMHKSRRGLVSLTIDRTNESCSISCWVLPHAGQKVVAGTLLHSAVSYAASNLGLKRLEWSVHATNKTSLDLSRSLRVGGDEYDMLEGGAYDSFLGKYVDLHSFRRKIK